ANALGFTLCGLLAGAVGDLRRGPLTYDHVGTTLGDGDGVIRFVRDVGRGRADFDAAVEALRTWVPQRWIGATVHPEAPPVPDATVVLRFGVGPLRLPVPNRVVAVVDEPDRYAFAYGTLPGHPERGEESFEVRLLADDTVRFTIRVHARPAAVLVPLAPLVGVVQRAALRAYLHAVADHVRRAREGTRQ
ncbi:MAG: DUF1990 domain-containing protein, partial [Actinomycetota bacterium]|nr:DUF1990 domain-containing protein [Actinomycetota bacterium]